MRPEPSNLFFLALYPEEWKVQALVDLQFYGGRLLDALNPEWRDRLEGTGHTPFEWRMDNGMTPSIREGLTALSNWVLYLSDEAIDAAMPEPEPVEVPAPDFHRWEYLLSTGGLE